MPRFGLLATGVTGGVTGVLGAPPLWVLVPPEPLVLLELLPLPVLLALPVLSVPLELVEPVEVVDPVLVEVEVDPDPGGVAAGAEEPASDPPQPLNTMATATAVMAVRTLKV